MHRRGSDSHGRMGVGGVVPGKGGAAACVAVDLGSCAHCVWVLVFLERQGCVGSVLFCFLEGLNVHI